jgi:PPOX class probable F420-dependent enzyme
MRTKLGPHDLGDLLVSQNLAILATHRSDGTTLLSPVWFLWEDGGFTVGIDGGDIKLRHIERDPRVTIVVCERDLPYRGFEIRGVARIADEPFPPTMRRIGRHYLGPAVDPIYPDGMAGEVVRIEPGETRGWDFVDDMTAMGVYEAT